MPVPEVLNNFKVFYGDEATESIGVATVTLPEITPKKVSLSGPGILGDLDMPLDGHTENMTLTINFRTITGQLNVFAKPIKHTLSIRGALQATNNTTGARIIQAVKVDVLGYVSKFAPGKFTIGEGTDSSVELNLTRLNITLDGANYILIDKLTNQYSVGGVDQLADINRALGI